MANFQNIKNNTLNDVSYAIVPFEMAEDTAVFSRASAISNINAELYGTKWTGNVPLTYNFPTTSSYFPTNYSSKNEPNTGFAAAELGLQKLVTSVLLNQYAAVSNLHFVQASNTATVDLTIAKTGNQKTAHAYFPKSTAAQGDVWFGLNNNYAKSQIGTYEYRSIIHELGHALGLKHGHEVSPYNSTVLSSDRDSMEFSVMTYRSYVGGPASYSSTKNSFSQTLMMYDIAAIQNLYGANFNSQSGNSVYTFNPTSGEMKINGVSQGVPGGNVVFRTVWDGNGVDTYDLSNYTTNLSIDLRPGYWSNFHTQTASLNNSGTEQARGNLFNALQYNNDVRSLIEKANGGSGNDYILGNDANNDLNGGAGNDTIDGGKGSDTLVGAKGNDSILGGSGNDLIYGEVGNDKLFGEEGNDTIFGGVGNDYLFGGSGNDVIQGDAGNDTLYGDMGNDFLIAGAGNDTLFGGVGNDIFLGGEGRDSIIINKADLIANQKDRFTDYKYGLDDIYFQKGTILKYTAIGADVDISVSVKGGNYHFIVNNAQVSQVQSDVMFF